MNFAEPMRSPQLRPATQVFPAKPLYPAEGHFPQCLTGTFLCSTRLDLVLLAKCLMVTVADSVPGEC
jgi:hypothetical protein